MHSSFSRTFLCQVAEVWTKEYFDGTLRDLSWLSTKPPGVPDGQRFDLVVWPESPAPFYSNDPYFRQVVGNVAQLDKTWLITGSIGIQNDHPVAPGKEPRAYNSALLVDPGGTDCRPLRQSAPGSIWRVRSFPQRDAVYGYAHKEVGDFEEGSLERPFKQGTPSSGYLFVTSLFSPTKCGNLQRRERRCWSTSRTMAGMAIAELTRDTSADENAGHRKCALVIKRDKYRV